MNISPGGTILLPGLPSAGKTTIATVTRTRPADCARAAEVLDGDDVRSPLWPELGLSREDREKNLNRITTVAILLARNGVLALVAAIAPYAEDRALMRSRHREAGVDFVEIHVATPLPVCQERDVKGLYARRARGELARLTGVDAAYEPQPSPDLRLDTSGEIVAESAGHIMDLLARGKPLAAVPAPRAR